MSLPLCIFASSKCLYRAHFDALQLEGKAGWVWVSNPSELDEALKTYVPRYVFFIHWNWRVPSEVWSRYECVCFHMTDVPYGRGGSPLQNLIKAGHQETKLTALKMVEGMDEGPVYAKRPMSLVGRAEEIYLRGGDLSLEIIRWMVETQPIPVSQEGEVTTFKRRVPAQSELPTEGDLALIYDHIRMLDAPTYPLAFVQHGEFRFEFTHAQMEGDRVSARVVINCISKAS